MPLIDYVAPVQVLVAVRGHPFDRTAFDRLFSAMPGIAVTMVDQPAAMRLMNPDGMAGFDALLLYDMPGLDFAGPAGPATPRLVDPGERFRAGFNALLAQGIGIVALHHALAGWPAWPGYADILGGSFLYRPAKAHGRLRQDSGYRHNVDYTAIVAAPDHPVMAGIPAEFPMHDELYLAEVFDDVTPLLRARHDFVAGNFYSAAAAVDGRRNENHGWSHPQGSDLIGWTRRAGNSPLVYLQPGDDAATYDNPVYRRLVDNAIRWVISPQARAATAAATAGATPA